MDKESQDKINKRVMVGCGSIIGLVLLIVVIAHQAAIPEGLGGSRDWGAIELQFVKGFHAEKMPIDKAGEIKIEFNRNETDLDVTLTEDQFMSLTHTAPSKGEVIATAEEATRGLVIYAIRFCQRNGIPVKGRSFHSSFSMKGRGVTGSERYWLVGMSSYDPNTDSVEWTLQN